MLAVDSQKKKRLSVHVVSMAEGGAGRKVNEVEVPDSPPAATVIRVKIPHLLEIIYLDLIVFKLTGRN
jgi:hypothetical protein